MKRIVETPAKYVWFGKLKYRLVERKRKRKAAK